MYQRKQLAMVSTLIGFLTGQYFSLYIKPIHVIPINKQKLRLKTDNLVHRSIGKKFYPASSPVILINNIEFN